MCQLETKKLQLTSNEAACVHEQVVNADCEYPLYKTDTLNNEQLYHSSGETVKSVGTTGEKYNFSNGTNSTISGLEGTNDFTMRDGVNYHSFGTTISNAGETVSHSMDSVSGQLQTNGSEFRNYL